jgi:hypothetical protein
MHKFVPRNRLGIFRNERTGPTTFDPKQMFGGVSDHFVAARASVKNGLNWCNSCTSSCKDVAPQFFATNTLDPLHWTLNYCIGHFVPFHYCRNFDAKRPELVLLDHKFVPRHCVEIFATNAPDPPHWMPNSCFWTFQTVSLQHESR